LQQIGTKYLPFIVTKAHTKNRNNIRIAAHKGYLSVEIEDKKGMQNLFFITRRNGDVLISVYDGLYHFRDYQLFDQYHYSKDIISIYEDTDSNVWIGAKGLGVKCFSGKNGFDENGYDGSYFHHLSISKTLQDKDGNYWFASLEKGIFYIPEMNIKTIVDHTNETDGFYITKIAFVQHILYIGTNDGSVYVHKTNGLHKISPFGEISVGVVLNFLDVKNGLFVSGSSSGTFMTGKSRGKKSLGALNSSCFDQNGNLLGCFNRSVCRIDLKGDTMIMSNPTGSRFETIICDSKNRIWLGGNIGLFQLVNNAITPVNIPTVSLHITDIKEYNGCLLIATLGNGVLEISEKKMRSYNTSNGLSSDMVNTIVVENDTFLWVGTTKGLCKVNLINHHVESIIDHRKGLPSDEIKMLALQGDTLFVGNNSFLSFFNTHVLTPNNKDPQIAIKNITVNENKIRPKLQTHFEYDQNNIEFTIHSYLYRELGNIKYKYRLKGLDNTYTYTNDNKIRFMFLPPGDYTFEAYALNEDRKESRIPVLYNFTIRQAYWKTTWFYAFIISISSLAIGSVIAMYFRRLGKKRKFQLQLLESKQQAFTNQMNPHFIFNALNSVQTYILAENKTDALNYLGKFSKLMRQTLNNTRESMVSLVSEIDLISHYIELEKSRYSGINYEIKTDLHTMDQPILIPSMLIQPLIENSIKHGILKKFDKDGMITINFSLEDNLLKCTISDDGIGINESKKIKSANTDHTSAGMQITLDRLKLYCQTYHTPFHFIIKDKSETNSHQSGTTVEFIIPYTLKHETHRNHH
jgi:hypothetical protein